MKLLFFVLVLVTNLSYAQGIRFENASEWKTVLQKAKAENKFIFVDCYASWCGPCKAMDKNVYPDAVVGEFYNEKFIPVKMQMDTTKNDDEIVKAGYAAAHEVMNTYDVNAFPTFLFFSPDGKLVNKAIGYHEAENFRELGIASMNPAKQFYTQLEKYKAGKMLPEEMGVFANAAGSVGDKKTAEEAAHTYMDKCLFKLSNEKLFADTGNIKFIYTYTNSIKDKGYQLLKSQSEKINKLLGEYATEKRMISIINKNEVKPLVKKADTAIDWTAIENTITKKYGKYGQIAVLQEKLVKESATNNWTTFGNAYVKYYDNIGKYNVFQINEVAWIVFEHCSDPKVLNKAIQVIEKYRNEKQGPEEIDTYANLLYKIGNKQKAIEWEQNAIEKDKERAASLNRQPDPQYAATLEKMEQGLPTWPL